MENLNYELFFEYSKSHTHTNSRKLKKIGHWRTQTRANAFSVSVVNAWNSLPNDVVTAPTISMFMVRLEFHIGILLTTVSDHQKTGEKKSLQ